MSDYLSNLAARTLGIARVARPRLSSRFEPPSAQPGGRGFYAPESEREETEQDSETAVSTPRTFLSPDPDASAARPTLDTAPGAPAAEAPRDSHHPPFDLLRRRGEWTGGSSPTHSGQKNQSGTQALSGPGGDARYNESIQAPAAGAGRLVHVSNISSDEHDAALDAADGGDHSASREGDDRSNLQGHDGRSLQVGDVTQAFGNAPVKSTARPAPARTPAFVVPRSAMPRAAAPAGGEHGEAGDAAPRIKITIGRVEVRAVMPAAAPPPARPPRAAPSSTSLEDYLRKGERGAR